MFLEAAARRCPVVATAAAVEAFGDDAHAMAAVAQEGSAAAMAERALAALAEPVATRRRAEAAYRHAAAHDAAAMLRQYAGLLRAAVACLDPGNVQAPMPTTPMPDHRARDAIAIAVIIPAHRQPGLLAEAIRSVLVQEGGPPAAAVVVDDGCPYPETSRTALAMAAAHPGRVFALRRPNGGLSAARNTGIAFALAAFPGLRALFCLDADNRLQPRFLPRAFAALEAAPPEVGWLYPDIDEIGRPQNFTTGGEFSLLMLLAENYCDAGSLMRRELVDRGLRFDERMRAGFEDWDFWLQAAGLGYVGRHLPERGLPVPPPAGEHVVGGGASAACAAARPAREARAPAAPAAPAGAGGRGGAALCAVLAGAAGDAPAARPGAGARRAPRTGSRARAACWRRSKSMETVHLPPVLVFAADAALDAAARARHGPQPVLAGRGAAARRWRW